jgi:hypothetical protein
MAMKMKTVAALLLICGLGAALTVNAQEVRNPSLAAGPAASKP